METIVGPRKKLILRGKADYYVIMNDNKVISITADEVEQTAHAVHFSRVGSDGELHPCYGSPFLLKNIQTWSQRQ